MTVQVPPGTAIYEVPKRLPNWLLLGFVGRRRQARAPFALSLSGGSTPRQLYAALAAAGARHGFPWGEAHWFWGDERFVPHDHIDSNFRMAQEAMFSQVAVPS